MPSWLENLRLRNLFGQPEMIGNDLPSQGGITGTLPPPPDMFGENSKNPFEGIFSQPPVTAPAQEPVIAPTGGGMSDIASRMSQIYSPETMATDRYNTLVDEMPQRNNPGMLRKIASVMRSEEHTSELQSLAYL